MRIQSLSLYLYSIPLKNEIKRSAALVQLISEEGRCGWGEIAPLPNWSRETLEACLSQLKEQSAFIFSNEWTRENVLPLLASLNFLPAASFGIESALLSLLDSFSSSRVPASALLMGTPKQILEQSRQRLSEGWTSAKLKVGHLTLAEAEFVIRQLKDQLRLRIDVNRAWKTEESLQFFSQFPLDAFDYVEEPFQNPLDLALFKHPLAIDESFPDRLTLEDLGSLPTLKALIYKPTIQGGLLHALPLYEWARKNRIEFVLSSSFESDLGLACIGALARYLPGVAPIGIGTYYYLNHLFCEEPLFFEEGQAIIPSCLAVPLCS